MEEAVRPPEGTLSTKDRILQAAVEQFAERGYNGASLRAIARQAGADLALIAYYFGSKSGLFLTIVDKTLEPALRITEPKDIPAEEVPKRVLSWLLHLFEESPDRHALLAVLRTTLTPSYPEDEVHEQAVTRLRDLIITLCGGPDGPREVYAFAATVVGVLLLRYVTPTEPIASISSDELLAELTPRLSELFATYGWVHD